MLSPEEHQRRLALYQQGLTDKEIAREVGCNRRTIWYWRYTNRLPPNVSRGGKKKEKREYGGVPMGQVLTPEECEKMRRFLGVLMTYANQVPAGEKPDLTSFFAAYREMFGPQSARNIWAGIKRKTEERVKMAGKMRETGMSLEQIGKALNVHSGTVSNWLKASGD